MAFTSTQLASIRSYLGYPAVFKWANPRLESAMVQVGNDPDASAQVITILGMIDNVGTTTNARALVTGGVKSLEGGKGGVELYQDTQQTRGMSDIGRQSVNRLSGIFGVPIYTDVFGKSGYPGDDGTT